MASLGSILTGSAIGQGTAAFPYQQQHGAFDRQRFDQQQQNLDFQGEEISRIRQQRGIEDTPTNGATDADRLTELATVAANGGRGDLQRKYLGLAREAKANQQIQSIAQASRAITLGQFQPATDLLNQSGLFGQIHGITLADDVEQDPRNPTYSVYTAGQAGEDGSPTPGPHVHVTQQMLYQLQAKPGDALHWLAYAQAQGQQNDIRQQRVDQQGAHWDAQDNHWQRQDAAALQKARATGGVARLTDKRWLYQWAQGQIGKPGGFKDDAEAMRWAMDPNRQNKDYWQASRAALDIQKSGGMFGAKELADTIHEVLSRTPIAGSNPPPPPPKPGALDLKSMGVTPVPGKAGVFADTKGRHFQQKGDRIEQWSPSHNKWVDVTDALVAR